MEQEKIITSQRQPQNGGQNGNDRFGEDNFITIAPKSKSDKPAETKMKWQRILKKFLQVKRC
jgi:hypothetical protein